MTSELFAILSPREKLLFDFLIKRNEATLDEIMEALSYKPKQRNNINSSIKMMGFKAGQHGYRLVRKSSIGRSQRAVYQLTKKPATNVGASMAGVTGRTPSYR